MARADPPKGGTKATLAVAVSLLELVSTLAVVTVTVRDIVTLVLGALASIVSISLRTVAAGR